MKPVCAAEPHSDGICDIRDEIHRAVDDAIIETAIEAQRPELYRGRGYR